ncbi:MAG: imidazole glycerol phosphate synthase subunit HisH [Planctomycetales bacterium 4572_13]|nr:MAG: imidazole glycerol phosphate synthase subunit HisH [Planctomycetales bacterium 4572_13]
MLVIIDYGVGNVRSVTNAFRYISSDVTVSCDPAVIAAADGLILPGVGASGYAMEKVSPIAGVITEQALTGKPLLGICVGFQLLFETSYEMGTHKCLGLIKGKVVPIPTDRGLTIPHMGWNYVKFAEGMRLFDGLGDGKHFAFANSFCAEVGDPDAKFASADYGISITAGVEKGNIFGCQFHPEKSAADGLQVLKNFVNICREESK